jgi:hypothetical protein
MVKKMNENELPEPEEGIDYYIDEWRKYTVSIDVSIDTLKGDKSDSEISNEAVRLFLAGAIDGDAAIVYNEKIKGIEIDYKTDLPFNRETWQISKCAELGFNRDGTPLRAWQKEQPKSQTHLETGGAREWAN